MIKYSGIIFDFDGTLFDTMQMWDGLLDRYLDFVGKKPLPNLKQATRKMTMSQAADYFIEQYELPYSNAKIQEQIISLIEDYFRYESMPKKGVERFLKSQYELGKKMCIATTNESYLTKMALERCGLDKYFQGIITCEAVGKGKTFPDVYLNALDIIGTNIDNTLVFEDSYFAIQTAKKAGFFVVGIEDEHNLQSYSDTPNICDLYYKCFDDIKIN